MNLIVANNNALLLTLHFVCLQDEALHNYQMSTENFSLNFQCEFGIFKHDSYLIGKLLLNFTIPGVSAVTGVILSAGWCLDLFCCSV